MLYTYTEIIKKYGSMYKLKKAIYNMDIYKIEKGLYSDKKDINQFEIINKKYPNAIYTLNSAFFYHNLTDVIPQKIYLAIKRDSTKINNKDIIQVKVIDSLFEVGKSELTVNNVKINIYDKERMLIELIRNRKSFGFDYYKEIINNYRETKNELDISKISDYINKFHNEEYLYDVIMKEVY